MRDEEIARKRVEVRIEGNEREEQARKKILTFFLCRLLVWRLEDKRKLFMYKSTKI